MVTISEKAIKKILLVSAKPFSGTITSELREYNYEVSSVKAHRKYEKVMSLLARQSFNGIILTSHTLGFAGLLELIVLIRKRDSQIPILVLLLSDFQKDIPPLDLNPKAFRGIEFLDLPCKKGDVVAALDRMTRSGSVN